MRHALTNTANCQLADAMALERAKLGDGARIVAIRRKAWNSYDLAYVVEDKNGTRKDVLVTDRALKRRIVQAEAPRNDADEQE